MASIAQTRDGRSSTKSSRARPVRQGAYHFEAEHQVPRPRHPGRSSERPESGVQPPSDREGKGIAPTLAPEAQTNHWRTQ